MAVCSSFLASDAIRNHKLIMNNGNIFPDIRAPEAHNEERGVGSYVNRIPEGIGYQGTRMSSPTRGEAI